MNSTEQKLSWTIVPHNTPPIIKVCNKCKKKRKFYCSEFFRVNAQKKRLDIWLIYKCENCDTTWNITIMSRVNPNTIDKDLYDKFLANDKETAWEYAFNSNILKRNCDEILYSDVIYTVEGSVLHLGDLHGKTLRINLVSNYKFDLRLDKVLKTQLQISREQLYKLVESSVIKLMPDINIKKYKIKESLEILIMGDDII